MLGLLATQNTGAILGPVAKILGWIMNAIFNLMDSLFNVQNVGLSIILFTIVMFVSCSEKKPESPFSKVPDYYEMEEANEGEKD